MTRELLAVLLFACLLICIATSSSLKQGETFKENSKLLQQKDSPTSPSRRTSPQNIAVQPRSRSRQPRSDAQPSYNEAVVQHLIQRVDQLSATVDLLKNQNKILQDNITELQDKNRALGVELSQSAQTIQQQTTALEAVLAQFASFRGEVGHTSQEQNRTLSKIVQEIASVNTKVTHAESAQNLTDTRLLVHDDKLSRFGQLMEAVEKRSRQTENDTRVLKSWRADVTGDVSSINVTQTQLVSDVRGLEERSRQASGVCSQLGTDVSVLQAKFASSTQSVVFYAKLSQNTERPRQNSPFPIIFDEVLTNQGDAYSATTGNFTVPVDGDYFFAATSMSSYTGNTQSPIIQLMVDEYWNAITNPHHPTIEAALRLRAGQNVWLRSYYSSSTFGRGMYFTGYLIKPVIN